MSAKNAGIASALANISSALRSQFPDLPANPVARSSRLRPMDAHQLRRVAHAYSSFGVHGAFGCVFGTTFKYVFFTARLQREMQVPRRQEWVPANAEFVSVHLAGAERLALRFPGWSHLEFVRRLASRLEYRRHGDPKKEKRRQLLSEQAQFHTEGDLRRIWEIQAGRCYYTGVALGGTFDEARFSVDHIVALANGGHDGPANLALVTGSINAQKRDLSHEHFLRKLNVTAATRARIRRINALRREAFRAVHRMK